MRHTFTLKGLWLLLGCLVAISSPTYGCLRLTGLIQDYATRQPLAANLFIKLAQGRTMIGQSGAGSGLFSVEIDCQATALIVERTGYQTQQLLLPPRTGQPSASQLGVIIPLVMLSNQTLNQVYQQEGQTHYEQKASGPINNGRPQRGRFMVTDVVTQKPLRATACLFSTTGETKRCFDTDAEGKFDALFAQRDIVAVEIKSPGYVPYQGNIIIDQLNGQQQNHTVRMQRELTVLSAYGLFPNKGEPYTVQLTRADNTMVPLAKVPGSAGHYCAYWLQPGSYQLIVRNSATRQVLQQQTVPITTGLNAVRLAAPQPAAITRATAPESRSGAATMTPPRTRIYQLPDEMPFIYFDQGSYLLDDTDRELLRQISTFMLAHPEYRLKIIGHTDTEGDHQRNRYLSEFRAKMVANYLFWQGIPDDRMSISGEGSRYPVAASDVEENKAKNRRVFLKLEVNHE